MKQLSETRALAKLDAIRTNFARQIQGDYEHNAKSCSACETPGACCLDAHFVNVHITRLEAVAIESKLRNLSDEHRRSVDERINDTIEKYHLTDVGDTFSQTYACPLFEKGTGCLVHDYGKPLPCIAHACYSQREDLPPDELLAEQEIKVDKLNRQTYGKNSRWLPLPIAIKNLQRLTR